MEHRGRVALVTGAAGGIGRAISTALAAEGARVALLDLRDPAETAAAVRGAVPEAEVEPLVADLADPRAAQAAVRAYAEAAGGVDILVNNAAINPQKPVDGYDLDEWERTQAINATAAIALAQAVVPGMKAKGWGRIVSIASVTLNGGWTDFTAYVASKGTLLGLTRAMARELGRHGIRVNAVSPGAIPTPLETEVWGDRIESYERYLLEHQALKYRGSADDVAEAVRFLVSERSRFVTGQNLVVDGGWWMP